MMENSKNINTAQIDSNGHVIFGDGNTIINLKEAAQYKALESQLKKLDGRFEKVQENIVKYPDDQNFKTELLQISTEQDEIQKQIEDLKYEVLKLADDFSGIPINTERLRLAKQFFETGEFDKARTILDAESMTTELDALLTEKEKLKLKTIENEHHLINNANEFLILSRLTSLDYRLPDRFEKTKTYFEQSLSAIRGSENLFGYASFLQKQNQFKESLPYYEEALLIYRNLAFSDPQTYQPKLASALNNLGVLNFTNNEYKLAEENLQEASALFKTVANSSSPTYLQDVAMTLNNLGILYSQLNDFDRANVVLSESLEIRRGEEPSGLQTKMSLAQVLINFGELYQKVNDYTQAQSSFEEAVQLCKDINEMDVQTGSPMLAMALNCCGELYCVKEEYKSAKNVLLESLEIRRHLAQINPHTYMSLVTKTLMSLGNLYTTSGELELAENAYQEALSIRNTLSVNNPQTFLPDVALTLNNLAVVYEKNKQFELAEKANRDALQIYLPLANVNPQTYSPSVAFILNNLATILSENNEFEAAESAFLEALKIRRELAQISPQAHLPNLAFTTRNLSLFYLKLLPDREKSLAFAKESIQCALPFAKIRPDMLMIVGKAIGIMREWGVDGDL